MNIIATGLPETLEDYQAILNATFEGGKVYGALVEREACAKLCENSEIEGSMGYGQICADIIRARGNS